MPRYPVEVTQRTNRPQVNDEQITAKVYFAVDPKPAANKIIVDLDRAPRNDKGLVEFSSDLAVMQPKDPSKSNGTALLDILNRGGKGMVGMFDLAQAARIWATGCCSRQPTRWYGSAGSSTCRIARG